MKPITHSSKTFLIVLAFCLYIPVNAQRTTITNENITSQVESELIWQRDVPGNDIDVETKDGIVMLNGAVENILAKERASNVAGAVRGVRGVVNEITVNPPFVPNVQLAADVKQALLEDPATDSYEIKVSADFGKVALSGIVDSWMEKKLTAYVAKSVRGVKEIRNDIDVKTIADRPDMEIKREIERAIGNDIRLYPRTVDVKVDNGNVSLSGTVGSLNDLYLARNYAMTAGVKEVKTDQLKIEDWANNTNLRDKTYTIRSDEEIKKAVVAAFLYDPRVLSFNPEVSVNNGIVTLRGMVSNLKAKRAAGADAQNVVGVTMVKNNLKVRPGKVPADTTLIAKVGNALNRSADVDRYEITVAAWKGKVYLNGSVGDYHEMYMAEDIASNVKGVKEVVNNLTVYNGASYDFYYPYGIYHYYYPMPYSSAEGYYDYPLNDTQIRNNIEQELWWSPFVDENKITVDVTGGKATLSGTIGTWRERNAAIENAYEGGANSVVDNLIFNMGMN